MRAIRKQQKQELVHVESSEEEDHSYNPTNNVFTFLQDSSPESEEQEEDEEESIKVPNPSIQSTSNRKKVSKKKKKHTKLKPTSESEDIDNVLKDLGTIEPIDNLEIQLPSQETNLLSVDPKMLDPETEIKKIFGSKLIQRTNNKQRNVKTKRKPLFTTHKDTWPRWFVSIHLISLDGSMQFTFTHSKTYQEIQHKFFDCVESLDPSSFTHLLQLYPYHIDSMIQLSDVSLHNSNFQDASEFIERVLYSFESSFHYMFNPGSNLCQLDYDRIENRSFFIALLKNILFIERRACWGTCFNLARFLLSLSNQDPMGALLLIDFSALKANKYQWVIDAFEQWKSEKSLNFMPNWMYSRALAEFMLENDDQSKQESKSHPNSASLNRLVLAIATFPSLIPKLLEKIGVAIDASFSTFPELNKPETQGVSMLTSIYVERCNPLYKEPNTTQWLIQGIKRTLDTLKQKNNDLKLIITESYSKQISTMKGSIPKPILRHVMLSNYASVRLPASMHEGLVSYNPFPPTTSNIYDEYFTMRNQRGNDPFAQLNPLDALMQSLLPWVNVDPGAPIPTEQEAEAIRDAFGVYAGTEYASGIILRAMAPILNRVGIVVDNQDDGFDNNEIDNDQDEDSQDEGNDVENE